MREHISLNNDWKFSINNDENQITVNTPHTWNGIDGQDGSNDYLKTLTRYEKDFEINKDENKAYYLIFDGINSVADVYLNDNKLSHHEGGYSRFILECTSSIKDKNELKIFVDNRVDKRIYPTIADFTFYGGIYRDVKLLIVNKKHFLFHDDSSPCLKCTPEVKDNIGYLTVDLKVNCEEKILIQLFDKENNLVKDFKANEKAEIESVHLWNGLKDPYLYTIKASLISKSNDEILDSVETKIGFRTFYIDSERGFFLNGNPYPLRGVAKHQDRPKIGNAISKKDMEEDMSIIKELGATTIRLSHYQHDQYFYDLCDSYGLIVWTEIPYISRHSKEGYDNAKSQLLELIHQNYNHPSIICYGISNEITMFFKQFGKDCIEAHKKLNEIAHKEDPTRKTTIACFLPMLIFNRVAHITDLVSYNLYYGWYLPFTSINCKILDLWHHFYRKTPIGLSEYGAEGMPNLHSSKPKRFDNTEEYQCLFHEKMLKDISKRNYIWATHVWNMFDFGSDGRNQGGEKGINHKGLVTFDRKIKKDAFYIYKAYWSDEPFVHICSKRYINRAEKETVIKVYSNQKEITLYNNDVKIATLKGDKVFKFKIKLEKINNVKIVFGNLVDTCIIKRVNTKDKSYILQKGGSNLSWQK